MTNNDLQKMQEMQNANVNGACLSTPHETIIAKIMNPQNAKDEQGHAANKEIVKLRHEINFLKDIIRKLI